MRISLQVFNRQSLLTGSILLLFLSLISSSYVYADDYSVSWESNFNYPDQDDDGWSVLTPSSDFRLIYVSSTDGDDSTATYYSPSDSVIGTDYQNPTGTIEPYATISTALEQMRDGYPDYLILKHGDTWTITSKIEVRAGRSLTERKVITYYGSNTARPTVNVIPGIDGVYLKYANYFALIGIKSQKPG